MVEQFVDGVGDDLGMILRREVLAARDGLRRFSGTVLTNAVCYDSWPIPSVKAMRRAAPMLRYLPETALYPSFVQLIHRGHDDRARALESIGVHWQHYVTHGAARSLMRQVSDLRVEDTLAVADRLPTLGLPARVVWGEADQFQKVEYGRRLAADLGTTLQPIPGGRHFTPEDHPEVVAAAVNELLGRDPGGISATEPPPGG